MHWDFMLVHLKFFLHLTQNPFLLHDEVALGLNLVLKSDLIAFKLRNSVSTQLILIIELSSLRIKCFLLLVKLSLALFS